MQCIVCRNEKAALSSRTNGPNDALIPRVESNRCASYRLKVQWTLGRYRHKIEVAKQSNQPSELEVR